MRNVAAKLLSKLIGPLHKALNGKEDMMITFHSFFKCFYQNLLSCSKLADGPKS